MSLDCDDLEGPIKQYTERNNEEFKIQVAIVDHVKGRKTGNKAFNAFIFHVYQGRDAKEGFFLKMLGTIPGIGDLPVIWRAKCECGRNKIGLGFLEVKKQGGIQSTAQHKFAGICHWLGVPYAIVRSVKEAHNTLVRWGCPVNHNAIKEPDIRTKSQKYKDVHNMYKP